MTVHDLYQALSAIAPTAFAVFKDKPPIPCIVYYPETTDNFGADNSVYCTLDTRYTIELYTDMKDAQTESELETTLKNLNLYWSKEETYIESEKLYMVTYSTNF